MVALLSGMLWGGLVLWGQTVAFTFDDGPKLGETPLLSPQARNQALLETLRRHQVRAALFVTLNKGADCPEGMALLEAWSRGGHIVANHTVTHPDLNNPMVSLGQYQGEILACQERIRSLAGWRPWFRYTFLRQGNTPEKRDGMRAFLKQEGLMNASVSLDTSDWRLDSALREVLLRDPSADLQPFRRAYRDHLRQRALAYRDLSRRLFNRDIPQVMLLHHSLLNALFLEEAISLFEEMGWRIIDPQEAYQDFFYRLDPQVLRPGQSLLLSTARSLGYRPEGLERLLDDGDADMAALKELGVHVKE